MAYFALSGVTGCVSPTTGITEGYDIMYNYDSVVSYYKKDVYISTEFCTKYMVGCVFANSHSTLFQFTGATERNNFYNSLPK